MIVDLSTAPRSKFTAGNYERLVNGMTLDEATAILGEPGAVDHTMRDMAIVTWYSPFDAESYVACTIGYPSATVKSKMRGGELPVRALLLPDEVPKRHVPSYLLSKMKYKQGQERRAMLMLDPPKTTSALPIFP